MVGKKRKKQGEEMGVFDNKRRVIGEDATDGWGAWTGVRSE